MTTPNPRRDLLLLCLALVVRLLIGVVALQIALWALFLVTLKDEWENPIMFLPLPLLSLAVLADREAHS